MPTFKDIAKYIRKFDVNQSFTKAFKSQTVQKFVIETIKRRLYAEGKTGSELKLKTDKGNPFYTDAYIKVKKRKGQKTSNVTLYLSGGFYQSFKFILISDGWRIDANWGFVSVHFKDLYTSKEAFQQDVMSLTEMEINTTMNMNISPSITKDFNETIYRP